MKEKIRSDQSAEKCNGSLRIMKVLILLLFIDCFTITAGDIYHQRSSFDLYIYLDGNTEKGHSDALELVKKRINGIVLDEVGESIIGANVVEVGTLNGTVTDIDGKFSLQVSENATIQITYIGYTEQLVDITGKTSFEIILKEDIQTLDEVQVVAYGSQKKVTVTGAISSISGEELLKIPTGSINNSLSGKIPGLSSVQYSGEPGADAADIYIRGITTFNNSSPLIQVDGVERDMSQIDPNEIESITVLKDASATAVFGVRGANGVILITTKRGAKGKAKISASTSYGVQIPTRLLEFANSYQYATYYNEAQLNDGHTGQLEFSPEVLEAFRTHSNPLVYPDMDWMDYILKEQAFQSQHNVNISGGTDNIRYFVSVGIFTQGGLFKNFNAGYDLNFDYNRYNYRTNLDFDITQSTILSLNIGGRVEDKNNPIGLDGDQSQFFRRLYWSTPFSGAGIVDGKWIKTNNEYISQPGDDALSAYYGRGNTQKVSNTLEVDFALEQKLNFVTDGLLFKIKGSYNTYFDQTKSRGYYIPFYTPVFLDINRLELGFDLRKSGDDAVLGYGEGFGKGRNIYFETGLNYARSFGEHNVGGLLLYNQSKRYYPKDTNGNIYQGIPMGYVGLVGRITYDFATKYMLEFNVGYNGSENFHPDRRYDWFPALSLGYVLSEESFMENMKEYIPYLKFRVSYGKVGNDKFGNDWDGYRRFMYLPDVYGFGGGYNFGTNVSSNAPGAYEGNKNNQFVTWETSFKQNYGIDLYTLSERLKFSFDLFKEHRENILISPNTIPNIMGISSHPLINSGIVNSNGYEIVLEWNDKLNSDFNYWIRGNMSFARNKIIEKDEVPKNEPYLYETGRPIGQPFLYKFWGFYDETANERYKLDYGTDIPTHPRNLQPGDAVYVDINGDGIVDSDDLYPIGYTNVPQYVAGVNIGLNWKNFDFSMHWNGAANTSRVLNETFRDPLGETNNRGLLLDHFEGRWTRDNAADSRWPRATLVGKSQNTMSSSLYLVNANYLRLKNVEVAYNINADWIRKLRLSNLRVYANAYNLLTFDKLKISDPESRTSDRPEYPLMRVMTVGLKLDF